MHDCEPDIINTMRGYVNGLMATITLTIIRLKYKSEQMRVLNPILSFHLLVKRCSK